jgi:quinol-cytochrome oxidoreductase complex cytochrome b subunit
MPDPNNQSKDSRPRFGQWLQERLALGPWLRVLSSAFFYGVLEERLSLNDALQKQLRKPVPNYSIRYLWCMGGISLFFFCLQTATGILLLMYYKPGPEVAYGSVKHIMNEVPLGWLLRQMHAWGSQLMIICVLVHMARVFFNKAYRPPRELSWVVGSLLMFITLTFAFTGYLLPWDQLSYWATTVGTESARSVPIIGNALLLLMRGGTMVSDVTLSRFFALHVSVLPWVTWVFLLLHFIMIRRQGVSRPL